MRKHILLISLLFLISVFSIDVVIACIPISTCTCGPIWWPCTEGYAYRYGDDPSPNYQYVSGCDLTYGDDWLVSQEICIIDPNAAVSTEPPNLPSGYPCYSCADWTPQVAGRCPIVSTSRTYYNGMRCWVFDNNCASYKWGVWDVSSNRCVRCDANNKEQYNFGDNYGIYFTYADADYPKANNLFETACSSAVDPLCDENDVDSDCRDCFDYCVDGRLYEYNTDDSDLDNVKNNGHMECTSTGGCPSCPSVESSSTRYCDTECSAPASCNNKLPGDSCGSDSCGSNILETDGECSSNCLSCDYTTTYTCDDSTHTECQTRSCGGSTYYCKYSGSWSWTTTLGTESGAGACHDGYDNDCDGNIDCADTGCQAGTETDCNDGVDNDCDGDLDCDDSDCDVADFDQTILDWQLSDATWRCSPGNGQDYGSGGSYMCQEACVHNAVNCVCDAWACTAECEEASQCVEPLTACFGSPDGTTWTRKTSQCEAGDVYCRYSTRTRSCGTDCLCHYSDWTDDTCDVSKANCDQYNILCDSNHDCDCSEKNGCFGSSDGGNTWHRGCEFPEDGLCAFRTYSDDSCPSTCKCEDAPCVSYSQELPFDSDGDGYPDNDKDNDGWIDSCDGLIILTPNQSVRYLEYYPLETVDIHTALIFTPIDELPFCDSWSINEIWRKSGTIRQGCGFDPIADRIKFYGNLTEETFLDLDYTWNRLDNLCGLGLSTLSHLDYAGCIGYSLGPVGRLLQYYEESPDTFGDGAQDYEYEPIILTTPTGVAWSGGTDTDNLWKPTYGCDMWGGEPCMDRDNLVCSSLETCYGVMEIDTSVLSNSIYNVYCHVWQFGSEYTWIRVNHSDYSTNWQHDSCIRYCWHPYATIDIDNTKPITVEFMNNNSYWAEFGGCKLERDLSYEDALTMAQRGTGETDFEDLEPQFYITEIETTSLQVEERRERFLLTAGVSLTLPDANEITRKASCMISNGSIFEWVMPLKESPDSVSGDNYLTDCDTETDWTSSFDTDAQIQTWDHLVLFYAPGYNRYELQIDYMNDFLSDLYLNDQPVPLDRITSCKIDGIDGNNCYCEHFTDGCSALLSDDSYRTTKIDLGDLSAGFHSLKFKIVDVCSKGYATGIRIWGGTGPALTPKHPCIDTITGTSDFRCEIDIPESKEFCIRPQKIGCIFYADDPDRDGDNEFENAIHYVLRYDYKGCPTMCHCEIDGENVENQYYLNINTGMCETLCCDEWPCPGCCSPNCMGT